MIDRTVFELAWRDLRRSKKALFALLVSLVPAILALLAFIETSSYNDTHWNPFMTPGLAFVGLTVTIPIACLILAGGLIADEAEDRTLSYLIVRPIKRRTLYASRGLAVLLMAVLMAELQVVTTWFVELINYLGTVDPGQRISVQNGPGTVSAAALLWLSLPVCILVAALAAALYTTMFGAGSVILPRYHFFGNLTFFIIWEGVFGFVPIPTAWLSGNHALRALLGAMDPTLYAETYAQGAIGFIGLPVVLALTVIWAYVGLTVMARRDFHVTSAAT